MMAVPTVTNVKAVVIIARIRIDFNIILLFSSRWRNAKLINVDCLSVAKAFETGSEIQRNFGFDQHNVKLLIITLRQSLENL